MEVMLQNLVWFCIGTFVPMLFQGLRDFFWNPLWYKDKDGNWCRARLRQTCYGGNAVRFKDKLGAEWEAVYDPERLARSRKRPVSIDKELESAFKELETELRETR